MKFNIKQYAKSPTFKILLIGFLVLLLLIPMSMVESVIFQRSSLYRQASQDITRSWGASQLLSGPLLTIPVIRNDSSARDWSYTTRYQHVKPQEASMDIRVDTHIRYRGIYKVPVYTAFISMAGYFILDSSSSDEDSGEYKLDEGMLQIAVAMGRSIRKPVSFTWEGKELQLQARKDARSKHAVVFTAKLPEASIASDKAYEFQLNMEITGSEALMFSSMAQQTKIKMASNWSSPSFFGRQLPSNYDISDQGFSSQWSMTELFKELEHESEEFVSAEWFEHLAKSGVRFIQPVDTYQTVTRSTKYAILFLGLTFLVYFIIEIVSKTALHPIQYLLVGFANCIFYLLLLSLAEHISFNLAYFLSSLCSILLITLYSLSIIANRLKALILFLILSALYLYLFVTLKSQDYALLFGSLGLFCALATVMFLTRNISWYQGDAEMQSEQ